MVLVCVGIGAGKLLLTDDGENRKRQVQMVTLLKPPPPPKIKEELPPPEVKQDEVVEMEEAPPEEAQESENDAPPGEELGLDADGVAGSDGFGLKANKGGRSLIGSGGGTGNQFAWYTRNVRHEIEKKVNDVLRKNGGVPEGALKTLIRIELDDFGKVVDFGILASSGDEKVDKAVEEAIQSATVSEPPPYGMPKKMQFKILS